MERYTIHKFNSDFPTEEACLKHITGLVYPDGIPCRTCEKITKHHRLSKRKALSCDVCGTHVYPLAGTIFEKSTTPLKSWFYAMFLISSTRCGISAKQLERELGVTYKTAWRMFNQIRKLMGEELEKFSGEVEADETYIGGKNKNRHLNKRGKGSQPGRSLDNKVPVVGVVQRGGKVAALVTKDASKASILPIIEERVLPRSLIYTDEWKSYETLGRRGFTRGWEHPHEHHRGVLVAAQAWPRWCVPQRQRQAPSGVRQRVRLSVQPPGRRSGDVRNSRESGSLGSPRAARTIRARGRLNLSGQPNSPTWGLRLV